MLICVSNVRIMSSSLSTFKGMYMYKPDSYNSVSPYLIVEDAKKVIDFLKHVFNASDLRHYERPDGSIMHAEVRVEDSVVMMGEAGEGGASSTTHVHVYVPDVDEVYKRALSIGSISVQSPVQNEGDPDRRGGITDPSGNTWWISTQVGG